MDHDLFRQGVWIAIQVVGMIMLADFIGGIFHWAEDTLGDQDSGIWGRVFVAPNVVHHEKPAEMMKIHWLINNMANWAGAAVVILLVWWADALSWQFWVFAAAGAMNQQAHRFAHASSVRLPGVVRWLQRHRILQSAQHHWRHHTEPHLTHYCVLTPWTNPIFDRIRFWRGMERIFVPIFGAPRRDDLKDRVWYRPKTAV